MRLCVRCLLLVLACSAVAWAQADPVGAALDGAKQQLRQSTEAARQKLSAAMDVQIKQIAQGGKLALVKAALAQKKKFLDEGKLPEDPVFGDAVGVYRKELATARVTLATAYEAAVSGYTKKLQIDKATETEAALEALQSIWSAEGAVELIVQTTQIHGTRDIPLTIVQAKYGVPGSYIDVTQSLSKAVKDNYLAIKVLDQALGVRRSARSGKSRLVVKYRAGTEEIDKVYEAGSTAKFAVLAKYKRNQATIHGLVVRRLANGKFLGMSVPIIATVRKGVYLKTGVQARLTSGAYGASMKLSFEEAKRAVRIYFPRWETAIVDVSFGDKYTPKDGGSAAGAFGVLLVSLFEGLTLDPKFAMTGDILVNGKIEKIGGVVAKIRGAMLDKKTIVGIPAENAVALSDGLILHPPAEMLGGIQVFTIQNMEEAIGLARVDREQRVASAIKLYGQIQAKLKTDGVKYLESQTALTQLKEVLRLAPNHVSAQYALALGEGTFPKHLSRSASVAETFSAIIPMSASVWKPVAKVGAPTRETLVRIKKQLRTFEANVHPDIKELHRQLYLYAAMLEGVRLIKKTTRRQWEARMRAVELKRQKINAILQGLRTNQKLLEQLIREGG
jgi:hypothetical protein